MPIWSQRAERAHATLLDRYLDTAHLQGWPGLFHAHSPPTGMRDWTRPMYWWQAHALDALVDAQRRSPSKAGLTRIRALPAGVRLANRGRIRNEYYDDMAWMALALLRADQVGGETIRLVWRLWGQIQPAWSDVHGGGIPWRRSMPDYKNVPANGPAAILAARLHKRYGDEATLRWAQRAVEWMHQTLVDPETGVVWDGINRTGDGEIDRDWVYTYNAGVLIGADLELRSITGDREPLERARRIAAAALDRLAPDGVLRDEGGGDAVMFKGILCRYLAELDEPWVRRALIANGEVAWLGRDGAGRFGPAWGTPPTAGAALGAHLSGLFLIERLADLERRGELGGEPRSIARVDGSERSPHGPSGHR